MEWVMVAHRLGPVDLALTRPAPGFSQESWYLYGFNLYNSEWLFLVLYQWGSSIFIYYYYYCYVLSMMVDVLFEENEKSKEQDSMEKYVE